MTAGTEARQSDIVDPTKLLRVMSMLESALDEAHHVELDDRTTARLAAGLARGVIEMASGVSEDLARELRSFLGTRTDELTDRESEIVISQLLGWAFGVVASDPTRIDPLLGQGPDAGSEPTASPVDESG